MAEKVIFEFRAGEVEGKHGFGFKRFRSGFADSCDFMNGPCKPPVVPGIPPEAFIFQSHHGKVKSRRHMKEALDFFERVYDDLYGVEASDESKQSNED